MKTQTSLQTLLSLTGGALLCISSAHAQAISATWDSDADGNWSDILNWTGNAAYAEGEDNTATLGNFITANRIINLDTGIIIGNITASDTTHNYTISGANTLTLARTDATAPTIDVTTSGRTLTISSQIAGNDGLTKSGAGILVLSNASNSLTGDISLNQGTLNFTALGSVSSGQNFVFTGNSTLSLANALNNYSGGNIAVNSGVTALMSASTGNNQTYATATAGSNTSVIQWTGNGGSTLTISDLSGYAGIVRTGSGSSSTPTFKLGNLTDASGYGNLQFGGTNNSTATFELINMSGAFTMANRSIEIISGSLTSTPTLTNNQADAAKTWTISTDLINSSTGAKTFTLGGSNVGLNTFSGDITNGSGTIAVTKTGAGTWALGGANTYSGDTNLAAVGTTGILIFQGSQALSANTTLKFAQSSSSVQSVRFLDDGAGTINFNRPIEFGGTNTGQNLNIFVGNNNTTNGGSSSGTTTGSTIQVGNITFTSVNGDTATTTLNATGANGYRLQTGTITLNNLVSRNFGQTTATVLNPTSANMTVAAVTMAAGNAGSLVDGIPILRLAGSSADNYVTGAISNSVTVGAEAVRLEKTSSSTWTLQGTNSYTGTTTISGGKLLLSSTGSLDAGSAVTVSGGALGGTGTVNGAVTVSSTGGINLADGSIGNLTLGSILDITGAAGANNVTFDLGNTTGTSDSLVVAGVTTVTTTGAAVINLNQLGGSAGRIATTYTLIGGAGTLAGSDFAKFSLATTAAYGQTYALTNTGDDLQLVASNVTAATPAAFWAGGGNNWSTTTNWRDTLAGGGAVAGAPDYQTNVTFSTTTPVAANLTTNVLDTDFNINSLTLTNASGNVTIGGTTRMLTIEAAAVNGNAAGNGIDSQKTSGTNTISAKVGLASSQTWTVATGGTLAVSGAISDFGAGYALTKAGGGNLSLSGATTYTGGTSITGGTLTVAAASIGAFNNGPLTLSGGGRLTLSGVNVASASQVSVGTGGGLISVAGNNSFTTTGKLTGSGALTLVDPGGGGAKTFNFNSLENDFTGGIILSGGAGLVLNVNSLANSANNIAFNATNNTQSTPFNYGAAAIAPLTLATRAIEINSGSFTGYTATITNNNATHAISIGGNLVATGTSAKTLALGAVAGPSNVYSGAIVNATDAGSGTIGVTKTGVGDWSLTNSSNSFTGAITLSSTTASAGTLSYASAGGANPITFLQTTSTATLAYTGASALEMSGLITASALTTGTITLDASGSTAASTINYSNASSLTSVSTNVGARKIVFTGTNTGNNIFNGVITDNSGLGGTAIVTKNGSGTWVLTGSNTYTGATNVNQGRLLINGSTSASSVVTVASGATLGGGGTVGGATTINGNLNPGNSPDVLSFGSSLTLGGAAVTTMEIDGVTRATQYDGVDVTGALAYGGALTLDLGVLFGAGSYTFDLFDFASESGDLTSVTLAGLYSGSLVFDTADEWALVDGNSTWTFTQSTGDLNLAVIPEPGVALLGCLGALMILRRRR